MKTFIVELEGSRKKVKGINASLVEEIKKSFNIGANVSLLLQEYDSEESLYFDVDDIMALEDKARLNVVIHHNSSILESTWVDENTPTLNLPKSADTSTE